MYVTNSAKRQQKKNPKESLSNQPPVLSIKTLNCMEFW